MVKYTINRLVSGVVVLFVISLITFFVLTVIPGDAALLSLGTDATPERLEALRESMGLNQPWYERYFSWLTHFLAGNWGNSLFFGEDVLTLIMQRLMITVSLAVLSLLLAIPVAAIIGIFSALYQDKCIDRLARTVMQLGDAIPQFWLALIFLVFFSGKLGWFPVPGFIPVEEGWWRSLHSLLLPSIVVAIGLIGYLIRIIRSSMLSALEQDFMLMTRVNGLSPAQAVFKYALRSAVIAPVTTILMQLAGLLAGTVLVESIFALPGVGRLLLVAVEQRDIILLQGTVMFITGVVVCVNFLADILYRVINPMIQFGGERNA